MNNPYLPTLICFLSALFFGSAGLARGALIAVGGSGQTGQTLSFVPSLVDNSLRMEIRAGQTISLTLVYQESGFSATTYATAGEVAYFSVNGTVFHPATAVPDMDIADVSSWVGSFKDGVPASLGDLFVFGWRYTPTDFITGDIYYGWSKIEYGGLEFGLIHLESYANDTAGGSVSLGVVPEPGAILLLALGAGGGVFVRRRSRAA